MKLNAKTNRLFATVALGLLISFPGSLGVVRAVEEGQGSAASSPSPAFPMPSAFPTGSGIKIDGSTSMAAINQSLQKQFVSKFGEAKVELATNGTEKALEAVGKGEIDLAAIGRPLTDTEKAQGLAEYVISREKIAIIVGTDNPFSGDLTFKQFAQMFRGEMTDWSKVGGSGAIRFIDRPEASDTRKSLSTYPVFKEGNFAVGANGKTLDADETAALIKELGKDGIGYAIASQALNQPGVKVLSMHKTLPDDPRYPYSQPRNYVYKPGADGNPSPAALAFLGYATSPEGQTAVANANKTEAAAVTSGATISPAPAASATPAATPVATAIAEPATTPGYANWWLPALLGTGLLGWLATKFIKGGSHPINTWGEVVKAAPAAAKKPMPAPVKPVATTPAPTVAKPAATPAATTATPAATPVKPIATPPDTNNAALPPTTTTGLGSAVAGLGAVGLASVAAAGVAKAGGTPVASVIDRSKSWVSLTAKTGDEGEVEWNILDADRAVIPNLPSKEPQVRVYDVTGGIDLEKQPAHSVQYYNCKPSDTKIPVTLPDGDREYVASVGYITGDGRWFKMAQSLPLRKV
jgi:phosphate transport system substrate-binding protein